MPDSLDRLASLQAGVLTREQALAFGMSRHALPRLVDSGLWRRLDDGLFLIGGSPTWESQAWAAVLAGGDHARLGGQAAGYAHRLTDRPPDDITVLIPAGCGPMSRRSVGSASLSFHRERPGVRDARTVGSPPRITVEDTVIDLARGATTDEVAGWVSAAVQRRLTTPRRLELALQRRKLVPHRRIFELLILDVAAGAESPLEVRYLRRVERAHGLPTAERQVRRRGTVADVLYRQYGLLVELDGQLGHTGVGRFRDMARDNGATTNGLATLRYGWADVDGRSCGVAHQVGNTLGRRGWTGLISACPDCPRS